MSRRVIGWILGGLVIVIVGAGAYLYFAGGSGEPSTELTTPPLASESTDGSAANGAVVFVVDPGRSVATFEIDEVLRGTPQHVMGTTSEVAGQVQLDPEDAGTAEFSQILVNARTFATDSALRDRAIRGPIVLNSSSDEFEFITFDVKSVDGLSGPVSTGDSLSFTITGDLHIKETTAPATFDVTAEMTDPTTISGTAETTVLREDFGIGIPNAPGVADVTDEVVIRLDFVAVSS